MMRQLAAAGLAAVLLGGCGVGLQETAEPLPNGAIRTTTPAPSESTSARETSVCFVNGRTLEQVAEPIEAHTTGAVMAALAAGPPAGSGEDLRTLLLDPLTGLPVLEVAKLTAAGEVVIRHTAAYLQLPADNQVLLMGQVACSMDSVGIERILLIDPMGQPAPAPLPDGRVREGAATMDDYRDLLADS